MMTPVDATQRFERHRPLALSLAYRMLGSRAESEDVVQEAWLKWSTASPDTIESERAWITTVVTRLCLDVLKSARTRREQYVGPWLPEPIEASALPHMDLQSISLGFLVLLESLSPLERAVLVLHDVFDYSHAEVAQIVGSTEIACRQALSRAKAQARAKRPRFASTRAAHERLLRAFMQAVQAGDLEGLRSMLAEDVAFVADTGGQAKSAHKVVRGRENVARGTLGGVKTIPADAKFVFADVNGWPSLLMYSGGRLERILCIECDDHTIYKVQALMNPDKLRTFVANPPSQPS
jgi:RNA polymerase sigma-70 factor, ECF subfamily